MTEIRNVVNILTYLIAVIGVLPLIGETGVLYAAAFFIAMIYGAWAESRKKVSMPRLWLNILSVVIILFTVSRMNMDNMVIPALEALLAIQAVKFIEPNKKFRDYMQIYMIAMFMAAGSALISLSIWFLAFVLVLFMLISVSMVLLTYMTEDERTVMPLKHIKRIIYKTAAIPLISIPVAVMLFTVLPRTNYPVFQFLNREDGTMTGFSDSVALGNVSEIQQDTRLIFRAEMPEIIGASPYWRGIVMDSFDGRAWSASESQERKKRIRPPEKLTEQTIYLEPYGDKYLFGLDVPFHVDMRGSDREQGFVYALNRPVQKRIQYTAFSASDKYLTEEYQSYEKFLELPALSGELAEFADSFRETAEGEELAEFMQVYFIRNGFKYSLDRLPVSDTPLEDFLFSSKLGNCEYYASAAAVILRRNGIPARLVGGYAGGYYNGAGGYYAVPQRNAHVWVEAYIEGRGWRRIDPTPASASVFSGGKRTLAFRMRLLADTVNFYWNALVINYDFSKQVKAVRSVRSAAEKLKNDYKTVVSQAVKTIPYILSVVILLLAWHFRGAFRAKGDKRYAVSFRRLMKAKGYDVNPSAGLTEIYIPDPELRKLADEFAAVFHGAYYRGRTLNADEKKRLTELLKQIKGVS
jgi:transglutaminase-like putative cysteine protease